MLLFELCIERVNCESACTCVLEYVCTSKYCEWISIIACQTSCTEAYCNKVKFTVV